MNNKKIFILIMLLVLLLAFGFVACSNEEDIITSGEQEESDFNFIEKSDGTYEVSSVKNSDINLAKIPNKYNDKPVTSLGDMLFADLSNLIRIEIPNSVTHIGEYAFKNSKAEIVWETYPKITTIGANAFYEYKGKNLNIPESVTKIEASAFKYCTSKLNWGENPQIKELGEEAFLEYSIKDFIVPDSVNSIGDRAFASCSELESITIGKNVINFGNSIFNNCINLDKVYYDGNLEDWCKIEFNTENNHPMQEAETLFINGERLEGKLVIPSTIEKLNNYTFYNCDDVISVEIHDEVTVLGQYVFADCSNLSVVTLGKGLTNISNGAFYKTALTNLVIPDNITAIEELAFADCNNLTSIHIPANLTSMSETSFDECSCLTYITVDKDNSIYRSENNCLIDIKNKELLLGGINCVIPDDGTVTGIGSNAFCGRSGLASIIIPNTILTISDSAFSYCTSLTDIVIPDSVFSIGNFTFEGCDNLTDIIIPASVKRVGMFAFVDCDNLTIYCEVAEKPISWDNYWNLGDCPVVWGYNTNQ